MEVDEVEFYRQASSIAKQSREGKFASKTPALLLPTEQDRLSRQEYFEALLARIKNQKLKTRYLFSLPYLKSELNKMTPKSAEKILNWWELLLTYKSLDIRFTETPFNPCIIGDNDVLVKEGSRRLFITADVQKGQDISREFSMLFKRASKSEKKDIDALRKGLGK